MILHFIEFVEIYGDLGVGRPKYKYHLQSEAGDLMARWDNVPHHRDVSSFPHHKHDEKTVFIPLSPADLRPVLDGIVECLEE